MQEIFYSRYFITVMSHRPHIYITIILFLTPSTEHSLSSKIHAFLSLHMHQMMHNEATL
jgi:hypothetical protein